jgi:hypothetical protein
MTYACFCLKQAYVMRSAAQLGGASFLWAVWTGNTVAQDLTGP